MSAVEGTLIGTRAPSDSIMVASFDGRQFRVEDDVVVRELLPSDPLWQERWRTGRHWSEGL